MSGEGADGFEAASREYWRRRHEAVKHLTESQYMLGHVMRLPLYLWVTVAPLSGLIIAGDMLHSFSKGVRTRCVFRLRFM